MKFLFALFVLFGLVACQEQPIYTTENLHCGDANESAKVEIYKNYVVVYSDLFKEYVMGYSDEMGHRMDLARQFDYMNVYEKDGPALVVHGNPDSATIGITLMNYVCFFDVSDGDVFKEKEYSLQSQTKKVDDKIIEKIFVLSDIEKTNKCISEIAGLTTLDRLCDEPVGVNGVDINVDGEVKHYSQVEAQEKGIYNCSEPAKYVVVVNNYGALTQEEALKITKNWDYNNIKLYNHQDQKLQEHEKDACDVLQRLNDFIKKHSESNK